MTSYKKQRLTIWYLLAVLLLSLFFSLSLFYHTSAVFSSTASAAPSSQLNFQGRLLGVDGGVVADGFYNIEFKLYDNASGGSSLWTETWNSGTSQVRITNGYFSVYLGTHTSFSTSIDWTDDKFLTMNVNGDGEMNPRFKLTAVPYAFMSANVASSDTDSADSNDVSIVSGDATTSGTSGDIIIDNGVGATSNGAILFGSTNASNILIGSSGVDTNVAGTLTIDELVTVNGGLTVESGDTFTFNGDAFTDLTGTGLQINLGILETTLGVDIESSEIVDGTIIGGDIANSTIGNANLINSQLAVNSGSGLAGGGNISLGGSRTLSLGTLTADWVQTGGYDIVLDNAGSELRIREASGIYYGELDVADITADRLYSFPDVSGDVTILGQTIDNGELSNSSITITAGTGLNGGGLVNLGGSVTLNSDLGASVEGSEITDGTIEAVDLEVTASPTDNYILTYDAASGGFTWVDPASTGGGGITEAEVEAYIFDGDNSGTLSSGTLALGSLSYTGVLSDTYISDTLTIGASSTVDDGALSANVSLLGSSVTLGTETTGNYVESIITGNGLQGGAASVGSTPTLALGNLTANWNQTAAYNIVLDNPNSQLQILDDGSTYYGTFNVGGLTANETYNFIEGGTILTSGNIDSYATTGITAGSGLTDGGTVGVLSLNIGAGTGLTVNADDIEVNYGSTAGTAVEGNTTITITASTGLSGGGLLTLGSGGEITLSVDLGDSIDSSEIVDNTIQEEDLELTNTATDNYVLTYDAASGGFTWVDGDTLGGATGVTSLNTLSGALSIVGNTQIGVSPSGSNINLSINADSITDSQLGANSVAASEIASTTVGAGSYGTASQVGSFTVDSDGRLTAASNTSIAINANQITSGTLTVGQGGTGAATLTIGGVLLGNGTGTIQDTGVLTNGQLLIGDGTGAPTIATLTQGTGITITNGSGSITIASTLGVSVDTTELLDGTIQAVDIESTNTAGVGTDNYLLSYDNATGGFTYIDPSTVGSSLTESEVEAYIFDGDNSGTLSSGTLALSSLSYTGNLTVLEGGTGLTSAGAAGGVYYSTGTAFSNSGAGSAGQCLLSGGAGTPSWGVCGGSGPGAATLQVTYELGNTITTTDARNIAFTLANTATDSDFVVNIATSSTSEIAFQNNGSTLFRVDSSGIDLLDVDVADFTGATVTFDAGEIIETELAQNSLDDSEIEDNSLTADSLAANSVDASELASTSVTANSYGSASSVATFTVDADGRLTAATTTSIDIAATQITSGTLSVTRGGTGAGSFTANGVIYGNGTGTLQVSAAGTSGQVLIANGSGVPTFTTLSGDVTVNSSGATTIGSDSVALGADTTGDYVQTISITSLGGLTVTGGSGESSTPTLALDQTQTIAANPALSSNQVIFGTTGLIFEGSTANTNELLFTVTDPTADRTITLPNASGTVAVSASGNISLSAAGDIAFTGTLPVSSGGTGATTLAAGVLFGNGTGAITSTGSMSNGQLLIGDGSGAPSLATLTQGSGITITNGAGTITIASTLGTDITGSEIVNNTIEEIDLEVTNVPTDNYVITYDSATGGFTWVDPATLGTTLDETTVESYIFDADNSGTLSSGTLALDSLSYSGDLNDAQIADNITISATGSVNGSALSAGTVSNGALVNSSVTIGTGSGLTGGGSLALGGSLSLALSALTSDWNQTGAFDVVLNNASSELRILESSGATYYGTFDVTDLSSDQTYTFNAGGTIVTSGNVSTYATTGITAGSGLTDGGTVGVLSLNIGAGTGLTVNADDIEVNYGSTAGTAVEGNTQITVTAGTGLSGGGSLTLGSGGSVTLNSTLGTDISGSEIVNNTIEEIDLEVTNAPTDNYLLSYDSATGGFTWVNPTSFGVDEATVESYIFDADNSGTLSSGTLALNSLSYTGSLSVSYGGTGLTAAGAAGGIYYSTGTAFANSGAGTSGQCLLSNGTSAPSWGSCDGGAGTATLQVAYDNGSAITTTDNRNIEFTLADTTTDSNFIINLQGADSLLDVQDAGTSKLTVDGSGNVGINDSTPSYQLDVSGTGRFTNNLLVDGNTTLGNASTDTITFTGRVSSSVLPSTDDTYDLGSDTLRWQDLYLGPNSLHIGTSGDEGVLSYNTTSNRFEFDRTLSIDAGADTNGGLFVNGTSQPNIMVANAGTIRARLAVATVGGGYSTDTAINDVVLRTEGSKLLFNTNGGSGASSLAIDGSDVGVGTTSPATQLEVSTTGSNNVGMTIDAPTGYYAMQYFAENGTNKWHYESEPTSFGGDFRIVESGVAARLIIQPGGNIGIANVSPSYPLDVTGQINASSGYRVNGVNGGSITCGNNQYIESITVSGGIITLGSCQSDVDTNSGGDITGVTAGNGLSGGGTSGTVSLAVGGGTCITSGTTSVSVTSNCISDTQILNSGNFNFGDVDADGGDVYVRNAGSATQYTRVHHNGSHGYIDTGVGNLYLRPVGAVLVSGSIFADNLISGTSGYPYTGSSAAAVPNSSCRSAVTTFGYAHGVCTSLQKYKDFIEDLPYGLETLRQLRPVKYKWNLSSADKPWDTGFIAEEIEAVNPIFAEYADGVNLSGVRYSHITSLITKSIQQLDLQVQNIQTSVDSLMSTTNNFTKKNLTVTNTTTTLNLAVTGTATITNIEVTGTTEVADLKVNGKIITSGNIPTAVLGATTTGQGSTYAVTGNDTAGTISLTTGTNSPPTYPLASGAQITVTFDQEFSSTPRIALTAKDLDSAQMRTYVETSSTGFVIHFVDTPVASTTYNFDYIVIQ